MIYFILLSEGYLLKQENERPHFVRIKNFIITLLSCVKHMSITYASKHFETHDGIE